MRCSPSLSNASTNTSMTDQPEQDKKTHPLTHLSWIFSRAILKSRRMLPTQSDNKCPICCHCNGPDGPLHATLQLNILHNLQPMHPSKHLLRDPRIHMPRVCWRRATGRCGTGWNTWMRSATATVTALLELFQSWGTHAMTFQTCIWHVACVVVCWHHSCGRQVMH